MQLLDIAAKAGVEDIDKSKVESEQDNQPDENTPAAATATPPPTTTTATAEDKPQADPDSKEDDKRIVTVATFGFPEVSIQPEEAKGEDEAEAKAEEQKESQVNGDKPESVPVQVCS